MANEQGIPAISGKIKATLEQSTLPRHEIKCYGRQITVECISRDSCAKWAQLLGTFARVRGMIKARVYNKATEHLGNRRDTFCVWRVYASID